LDQLHTPAQELGALAAGAGSDVVSVTAGLARIGLLAAHHLIRFVHSFASSAPLSARRPNPFTPFSDTRPENASILRALVTKTLHCDDFCPTLWRELSRRVS
jgi:hypothetical protein